jgi:hypothetical protein
MKEDQLDRLFADDEIMPSAGFTASVMDAIRRDAATPPPIAFPWKRAFPGVALAALTLILAVIAAATQAAAGSSALSPEWMAALDSFAQATLRSGALWVLGALLLSFVCVRLSMNYSLH